MLDDYRRSFNAAYEVVVVTVRESLNLEPTGRPAKSTGAIVEKLQRETIRLSQMQDIAGCRVVVRDVLEQDRVVADLVSALPRATVADRRAAPSYGYRAVHIIVEVRGRLVEIQVRTALQHTWAELSEKLSDVIDPSIKYGGGPDDVKTALKNGSTAVNLVEQAEKQIAEIRAMAQRVQGGLSEEDRERIVLAEDQLRQAKRQLDEALRKSVAVWLEEKRPGQ